MDGPGQESADSLNITKDDEEGEGTMNGPNAKQPSSEPKDSLDNNVSQLLGATIAAINVMKDLVPINLAKGILGMIANILIIVQSVIKNKSDFLAIVDRCETIREILERATKGATDNNLRGYLGHALSQLNVEVASRKEQGFWKKLFFVAIDRDQIAGWEKDLDHVLVLFSTEAIAGIAIRVEKLALGSQDNANGIDGLNQLSPIYASITSFHVVWLLGTMPTQEAEGSGLGFSSCTVPLAETNGLLWSTFEDQELEWNKAREAANQALTGIPVGDIHQINTALSQAQIRVDTTYTAHIESQLTIEEQWTVGGDEYNKFKGKCLVVMRLFELSKFSLSGMGYKLQQQIGKVLQRRSEAIRNAINKYNVQATALNPPRARLSWKDIADYSFLGEFDVLRHSCTDIRELAWAKPTHRESLVKFFKLCRAHEEVEHLNIEVCRLWTAIHDEGT
ncbi:uncharacterized protein EDB91DRAFT_1269361 [Suillus paluster]|uniref:uncharacterized protein n=1 Tax=Suillus paluster TaxID=48578 RepID=UPI001B861279|nr:uncharacterized protein EDB91DRAFT_1269361 [Suillus paluster]KAG1724146.1 hypothetical protein EDB91DRAFT_1269361 [Suillus paluster]